MRAPLACLFGALLVLAADGSFAFAAWAQTWDDVKPKFLEQDLRMQDCYDRLRLVLDRPEREGLAVAQEAWLTFRDMECKWTSAAPDGSSQDPVAEALCLVRVTKDRAGQLHRALACEPGDTRCLSAAPVRQVSGQPHRSRQVRGARMRSRIPNACAGS